MVLTKRWKKLREQWENLDLSPLGIMGSLLLMVAARQSTSREREQRDD